MIIEYHRPETVEDALNLLGRSTPITVPMGGGTTLSQPSRKNIAVVDLINLGLNYININDDQISIGATTTLQQIYENKEIPSYFRDGVKRETNLHIRNTATLGGTLIRSHGQSLISTCLLASDAQMTWLPGCKDIAYYDWLITADRKYFGLLITQVTISSEVDVRWETIERTPGDVPSLIVAAGFWKNGRVRLAMGGATKMPFLVSEGYIPPEKAKQFIQSAHSQYIASKLDHEYLLSISDFLIKRLYKDE